MSIKAVLCVPIGHKWEIRPDSDASYPVLRCRRLRGMFDPGRRR